MNTWNLYLIREGDILKISTLFPLLIAAVIAGAGFAVAVVLSIGFGSWVAFAVAFTLVLVPLASEYRARRLARLLQLPHELLTAKSGVQAIPWTSVHYIAMKGRKVTFRLDNGWISAKLDSADATTLSSKASAVLGDRFTATPEKPPRFSPAMKLLLLTLLLFALTQVIMVTASLTPYFPGEQQQYTSLYNSTESGLKTLTIPQEWGAIFFNNIQIALSSLVPGFGFLILGISSYNTGRVVQAAAIYYTSTLSYRVTPADFLLELYILPHTWVEELSYPLSTALGIYGFTWRHESYSEFANWKTRASTKICLGFLVVTTMLAIAAVLEVSVSVLGLYVLLLWIPVALGALIIILRALPRYKGQMPGPPSEDVV